MLYNHINDVKDKLHCSSDLRALPCKLFILIKIEQMETIVYKYYKKTHWLTVYKDAIILNPWMILSIFEEETWKDISAEEYSSTCHKCFVEQCSQGLVIRTTNCMVVVTPKWCLSDSNNNERYERYKQQHLSLRNAQPWNEYNEYIEISNDSDIKLNLI